MAPLRSNNEIPEASSTPETETSNDNSAQNYPPDSDNSDDAVPTELLTINYSGWTARQYTRLITPCAAILLAGVIVAKILRKHRLAIATKKAHQEIMRHGR
jgi:hypothetical protein